MAIGVLFSVTRGRMGAVGGGLRMICPAPFRHGAFRVRDLLGAASGWVGCIRGDGEPEQRDDTGTGQDRAPEGGILPAT